MSTKVHLAADGRGDSGSVAAALHRELSDVVKGHRSTPLRIFTPHPYL
ncbi:hypothetical protein [Streptomyces sp. NPDC048639]